MLAMSQVNVSIKPMFIEGFSCLAEFYGPLSRWLHLKFYISLQVKVVWRYFVTVYYNKISWQLLLLSCIYSFILAFEFPCSFNLCFKIKFLTNMFQ